MWRMLQQETPDDYVLATGESYSVRDFCERAGRLLGMDIYWEGEGLDEIGIDRSSGKTLIKVDERYFRPSDVDYLIGDPTKAREVLGWDSSDSFQDLVEDMVYSDFTEVGGSKEKLEMVKKLFGDNLSASMKLLMTGKMSTHPFFNLAEEPPLIRREKYFTKQKNNKKK
jgi:hypothetical protein